MSDGTTMIDFTLNEAQAALRNGGRAKRPAQGILAEPANALSQALRDRRLYAGRD